MNLGGISVGTNAFINVEGRVTVKIVSVKL